MPRNELTQEERDWAMENPDAVREAMKAVRKNRAAEVLPDDPIERATHLLKDEIAKKLRGVQRAADDSRERIERYRSYAASDRPEVAEMGKNWLESSLGEYETTIRNCEEHLAGLRRKLERLADDPESCFLPIGTVVKFIGLPEYRDSTALGDDSRLDYPVVGSVGVVSRLNGRDEHFLGVTMRREFKTGYRSVVSPTSDRTITYRADPEMFEILGYGTLPDGSEYRGYGYIQTHQDDEDEAEMVLEADGFFWRFHDFGGNQGMEVLDAYEDIAEMGWLGEPLPIFTQEKKKGPSGP